MEGDPEMLAAMADSLKVSDSGGHPDGQSTRMQDEDCFYDCEETFHAERTSPAINRTEMTHSEGTVNGLQTESNRNPDTGEESAQASNPFEGNAATRGHEPPEKDGVLGEEEYERIEEEDERKKDMDSEFKEEATKPSEYDDEYLREAEKNLTEEEKEVSIASFTLNAFIWICSLLEWSLKQNARMSSTGLTLLLDFNNPIWTFGI